MLAVELFAEVLEHADGGDVDVGHGFGVEDNAPGLGLGDTAEDLVADMLGVGEEESAFGAGDAPEPPDRRLPGKHQAGAADPDGRPAGSPADAAASLRLRTMGGTIGQILPLAVAAAISLVPIIASVLLLLTPRAASTGTAYVVG